MKNLQSLFTVIFVIVFTGSFSFAQELPNHSFEDWSGNNPVDWWTNDLVIFDAVTQTSDAWQGSSAAQLTVLDGGGGVGFIPLLAVGDFGSGTPVSQRYGSFGGYYKFNPIADESFNVLVNMLSGVDFVGTGFAQLQAAATWTEFNVPIQYTSSATPDVAIISFNVANQAGQGDGTPGSWAIVDYVMFGAPTDVETIGGQPVIYSLSQNYPNPFNPSTLIEYSIPEESFVELKVYDILGNEVVTLLSEQQPAGNYRVDFNADNNPAGLYFARLTANDFTKVIKMTLLK